MKFEDEELADRLRAYAGGTNQLCHETADFIEKKLAERLTLGANLALTEAKVEELELREQGYLAELKDYAEEKT